jgi:chemotaxis protein MotA
MDILTFVGLALGVASVYYTMLVGNIVALLFNLAAFILVGGGTLASTFITYPWSVIKNLPKAIILCFFPRAEKSFLEIIDRYVELSEISLSEGVDMVLEYLTDDDEPIFKLGIQMIVEGQEEENIETELRSQIEATRERHSQIHKVLRSMGGYAPIFGLLGTLIGVIQVLQHIGDPKAMSEAMAIAVTTTFYGIFAANFFCIPMAGKLEFYSEQEILRKEIALAAVIGIKQEVLPSSLRRKLEQMLPKKEK